MCCEDIFNDVNAQKPPQFNERPRKLEKKHQEGREREKKARNFGGPAEGGSGAGGGTHWAYHNGAGRNATGKIGPRKTGTKQDWAYVAHGLGV